MYYVCYATYALYEGTLLHYYVVIFNNCTSSEQTDFVVLSQVLSYHATCSKTEVDKFKVKDMCGKKRHSPFTVGSILSWKCNDLF